jgi:hypothetical protein
VRSDADWAECICEAVVGTEELGGGCGGGYGH